MYALKCSVNGEIFKTTFNKESLPIPILFQENSAMCGLIMANPNTENEINIGGIGTDGAYALADGTLNYSVIPESAELVERSITIQFLPYEGDGDELNSDDKDVYYLIHTEVLPKSIHSCAFYLIGSS